MPQWPAGWKPDLIVTASLGVSLLLYVAGLVRMFERSGRTTLIRGREIAAFLAGWVVLVAALLSPIAVMSELLLSVHMTQHELLILVAAPLVALGRPIVPWLWALPPRLRRRAKGSRRIVAIAGILTAPVVVFVLHAFVLWIWHVPVLYQAAVLDDRLHAVEHITLTATACLFWWGLVRGRYGRVGYGTAVVYVFATALQSGGLGALMALSPWPWYALYVDRAAANVDPQADQQLAGLLMWIPGGVILTIVALALRRVARRLRASARDGWVLSQLLTRFIGILQVAQAEEREIDCLARSKRASPFWLRRLRNLGEYAPCLARRLFFHRHVRLRDHADNAALRIRDWYSSDLAIAHKLVDFADVGICGDRDQIV